jgi:hypothetical protein
MHQGWYYEGKPFDPTYEALQGWQCFVYIITDPDGKSYVGVKQFHKKVTRPPLKGRKNKRRSIAESDWKSYVGSSTSLQKIVEERGTGALQRREILHLCRKRGDGAILEAMEQLQRGVLWRDDFHNAIINMRVHEKHLSEELKEKLRNDY